MEKPEGNRTLGSPNVRWENNINRMEAIPLCSLLNKLQLFIRKQQVDFDLNSVFTRLLLVSACTQAIPKHVNTKNIMKVK